MPRSKFLFLFLLLAGLLVAPAAMAQQAGPLHINLGDDLLSSQRIFQMLLLVTVLSVAPSLLLMVTSFTRLIIVFSFLRSAIGMQTTPPNAVLVSLALFLTAFIMAPTLQSAYETGITPYLNNQIDESEALTRSAAPFKRFMLANVRDDDLGLFISFLPETQQKAIHLPGTTDPKTKRPVPLDEAIASVPLQVVVPSFMISELRRAFEIGFLLFLPFLVIDLTVASILMSMGMMMLPPVTISLPFKIIFFVLVDGWHLLTGTMVESFKPPL